LQPGLARHPTGFAIAVTESDRFTTDQAGYTALRAYAKSWLERVWAAEGANGAGRPLAQRLLEAASTLLMCGRS
jgi:hypothetical protein